ncbi:MAG: efflux RND transporter permease subunit, partial [Proteobacteria bacterium]|nr:efflux RND transporter permease subunit [Pseudomonadota bacterium]
FRSAFIVAVSLPLSVLFAFIMLSVTGQAINSITLGGIALVLGLLVDNSIVVLENIDRHLAMGKSSYQASLDAALEVANPVLASSLVIMVVFFPVFFLTGITKFLFSPLAITVGGAMVGSYIFSLTLVPLAAGYFLKDKSKLAKGESKNVLGIFRRLIDKLKNSYSRSLVKAVKYRWGVLIGTVCLFVFSVFMMKNLGYELFPQSDVGQMEVQVRMESGTPLSITESTVAEMEGIIKEELSNDLEQLISNIGKNKFTISSFIFIKSIGF